MYLDLETGGLNSSTDPIVQICAIAEIDGVLQDSFNKMIYVPEDVYIDPVAAEINGYSRDLPNLEPEEDVFKSFKKYLDKYINKYNTEDKFYVVTYNGHSFDMQFMRTWFKKYDKYGMGSYFWNPCVDVMLLSLGFCIGQRHLLGNFKLATVAKSLDISVAMENLHDAEYDVYLTREIFKKFEPYLVEN